MDSPFTTLYIVRHGQTDWNVKELTQGHTDIPLNETGRNQALETAGLLKDVHFDEVFSSDLSRASQTAEIIAVERNLAVNTNKLLRERNWGKYEGQPASLYREENKALFENLKAMTKEEFLNTRMADAETDQEVISRVITFLREVAATYINKNVLVVSHGGVMATLLIHLGWGEPRSFKVDNAAFIELHCDGIEFEIKRMYGVEKIIKS